MKTTETPKTLGKTINNHKNTKTPQGKTEEKKHQKHKKTLGKTAKQLQERKKKLRITVKNHKKH